MGHWLYEMDCGHFQTRAKYSTRWLFDEEAGLTNVQAQCKFCNLSNGGQQYIFGKRLDEVYGEGSADKVVQLSNQTRKYSTKEIVELRKSWEARFPE